MTPASTMGSQSRLRSASQSISLDSTPPHCTLSRTIGPTSPRKKTAVATTINKCVYHLACGCPTIYFSIYTYNVLGVPPASRQQQQQSHPSGSRHTLCPTSCQCKFPLCHRCLFPQQDEHHHRHILYTWIRNVNNIT